MKTFPLRQSSMDCNISTARLCTRAVHILHRQGVQEQRWLNWVCIICIKG